jgi:hypothetical protein
VTANFAEPPTQEEPAVTITKGLIVRFEAKAGKEEAVAAFLGDALATKVNRP